MEFDPSLTSDHGEKSPNTAVDAPTRQTVEVEFVVEMKKTVESLQVIGNAGKLRCQSEEFNKLDSLPTHDPLTALAELRETLRGHDEEHVRNMQKVREDLQEEFRQQYEKNIRDKLREQVRAVITEQVKVQVDAQLKEQIPVSLRQQLDDTKQQLKEVKISLQNSEARTANSELTETDMFRALAVVLTPEGKKSDTYPQDLCSLFAYDLDTTRALVREYGLVDSEVLEVNFKRFLAHIGIHVDLFPSLNRVNGDLLSA